MTGFSNSNIIFHELPNLPPELPFLFDDCSLAFYLRIRPKSLWWIILNPNKRYRRFTIRKKRGKRTLYAPEQTMKAILQRFNERILDPLQAQLGPHVTAYRRELSAIDAVRQHIPPCSTCDAYPLNRNPPRHECPRRGTYIQLDLKDFFPSTSRAYVRHYFKSLGYSHDVSSYMAAMVTVTNIRNPKYRTGVKFNPDIRKFFAGVPQGSPTAGAVCNLVANHRIDPRLFRVLDYWNNRLNLAGDHAWHYTRYSDDLTFTCGHILSAELKGRIVKDLVRAVRRSGYNINPRKTRVSSGWKSRRHLLGMTFNSHPNFRKEWYKKLRAVIHNCGVRGFKSQIDYADFDDEHQFINWLRGTIGWVCQINPQRGQPLLDGFKQALQTHSPNEETEVSN